MFTTARKRQRFVSEPVGDKDVTELPGISEVLGTRLKDQGYDKASVVLFQFLLLKKDKELFAEWLKDVSGANKHQAESCAQCLNEWCNNFL